MQPAMTPSVSAAKSSRQARIRAACERGTLRRKRFHGHVEGSTCWTSSGPSPHSSYASPLSCHEGGGRHSLNNRYCVKLCQK